MASMQTVMDLGRSAREKRGISLKTPVKGITVVCKDGSTLNALGKLESYVKGELNAWEVRAPPEEWAKGCIRISRIFLQRCQEDSCTDYVRFHRSD